MHLPRIIKGYKNIDAIFIVDGCSIHVLIFRKGSRKVWTNVINVTVWIYIYTLHAQYVV